MTQIQFEAALTRILPLLRRFARRLTRSAEDADDLLQSACLQALQKRHCYTPSHPLERWMYRVIRNLWLNEIRARTRRPVAQMSEVEEMAGDSDADPHIAITARQVRDAINSLPKDIAQPLLLVCDQGFSYREAAEHLDVPIGTIMSRVHRARQSLMALIPRHEICDAL